MSVREFMEQFLAYKERSDTIEPSTACGHLAEAEVERLTSIHYDTVSLLVTGSEKALFATTRTSSTTGDNPKAGCLGLPRSEQDYRFAKKEDLRISLTLFSLLFSNLLFF